MKYFEESIQILQELADKIQERQMSLKNIPGEVIQSLVLTFMGKEACKYFLESYKLAAEFGDEEQQAAVILMLRELIRGQWEKEKEKEQEIFEKERALSVKYGKRQEITTAYFENEITEEFICDKTWEYAAVLKQGKSVELFSKVCDAVNLCNIERIKKQDKIRVAFLTKDSTEWSVDVLYQQLAHDERYEVCVLVAPFFVGSKRTIVDTYNAAIEYFKHKGYLTIGMCDIDKGRYLSWENIPKQDVVFLTNPHFQAFEESCNIVNFPLRTLNIYIPYGFSLYGNIHDQYNQLSHALCWKIFWETEMDLKISEKYADLGNRNGVVSGYLKMDGFYEEERQLAEEIWKIPEGKEIDTVRKIIYAPHWSIRSVSTGFGNFDKMYDKMYNFVKEHADTTTWIFRPHPMLRWGVVKEGLFDSEQEFDEYMRKWDELPNARVVERGEYIDMFRTSDALIGDSISFLGEYQYTHKPLLFITREANTFDDFGEELIKILYQAEGENFEAVERFVNDVVIEGKDFMYEIRKEFFEQYMDYMTQNGKMASDYIKDFLDDTFC